MKGDSGGPLMCLIDNLPVQFGLTSWGGHCEEDVAAGVYADLSQFRIFIKEAIYYL